MKHLDPRVIRLIQDKVRLSRLHRWSIYLSLLLLTLSGLAWLLIELAVAQEWLDYQALRWLGLALKFHGAAAYLSLLGFGSVLARHVKRGWFLRRNRVSGSLLIATMIVLALTGYLLYYIAGEESRPMVSTLHWLIGLLGGVCFPVHLWQHLKHPEAPSQASSLQLKPEQAAS